MSSRREKIEAMLQDEPQDDFLRYSLAMEQASAGEQEPALELLEQLTTQSSPYVPAFFRSGQILAEAGQTAAARTFLRDGIDEARNQGDMHAAAEMSELLAELGQGGDVEL